jgi:hypothetical protein
MANFVYSKVIEQLGLSNIDWVNDDIRCALMKSTYTPNKDHDFMSDIVADEADCTGYTGGWGGAGRVSLGVKTVVIDDANDRVEFDGQTDPTWAALGNGTNNTLGCAVIFKKGTSDDSDAVLIACIDTVSGSPAFPFLTNGSSFTLTIDADGLLWGTSP